MNKYVLKLFILGQTSRSKLAIANLYRICEENIPGKYELQIIDVLEQPQMAEDEKIIATPTLVRYMPPPYRRIVGDFTDTQQVLIGLDLFSGSPNDPRE